MLHVNQPWVSDDVINGMRSNVEAVIDGYFAMLLAYIHKEISSLDIDSDLNSDFYFPESIFKSLLSGIQERF